VSDSTLFVVRVWRQWASFRASVRRVDDEDTRLFEKATDVARYLETSATPSMVSSDAPPVAESAGADPEAASTARGERGGRR